MYCPKCHKEVPDGAMFCNYCGSKVKVDHEKSNKISNYLLIAWTAAFVIISISRFVLLPLVCELSHDRFYVRICNTILTIVFNLIMLLPVIAIRNKAFRIIGIVIMSIIILLTILNYFSPFYFYYFYN